MDRPYTENRQHNKRRNRQGKGCYTEDIIILTSPIVKYISKTDKDQFIPNITVLSYSEIDNTAQIQAIGNIAM